MKLELTSDRMSEWQPYIPALPSRQVRTAWRSVEIYRYLMTKAASLVAPRGYWATLSQTGQALWPQDLLLSISKFLCDRERDVDSISLFYNPRPQILQTSNCGPSTDISCFFPFSPFSLSKTSKRDTKKLENPPKKTPTFAIVRPDRRQLHSPSTCHNI